MLKALKSRTIQFALLLATFGAIEANMGLLQNVLTPDLFGYFSIVIGVIVAILRVITTTALSDK